ncbi:MAG: FHA domain-containing protein [Gemmatimonadales bacterium]|nr:FHA domain-containing protein [Gemmatimonadales bacterium]
MYAQFRYRGGPRAGEVTVVGNDFVTIGRHPASDLAFDPERDLEVSVRHAAVFKQGGSFLIRDLASSNGTFRNGKRIRGDQPIEPGDVLRFGPSGPEVEFSIATSYAPTRSDVPAIDQTPTEIFGPRTGTAQRVQREVVRQTRPWKALALAAVALAVIAAGIGGWQLYRTRTELTAQRTELMGRIDQLLARLDQGRPADAGVRAALAEARHEVDQLKTAVTAQASSAAALDTLSRAVVRVAERPERVLAAATLDPASASGRHRAAVAVIAAESPAGRAVSGTGFAVRSTADTVWLATARHLVRDAAGVVAARIAVIFDGSAQAFRGAIAGVHDSADVAIVRAVIRGGAGAAVTLADRVAVGDAVALYGYPFGLDSLGDWRQSGVRGRSSVGTVAETRAGGFDIDGYGTYGSSGSPVFTPDGQVVGLVSGRAEEAGRLVVVPAAAIRRALDRPRP